MYFGIAFQSNRNHLSENLRKSLKKKKKKKLLPEKK